MSSELQTIMFPDGAAWEAWLRENHQQAGGLWINFAKKKSPLQSVYYPEALEIALCYGWIDGQVKSLNEDSYVQKFTPRRPRSTWSKINRVKVEKLIAAGRVQPAGLAEIEQARADGRWDRAYDSPATAKVPEDLLDELKRNKKAAAFFETLNSANRYAILWRLQTARKPETRQARMQKILGMLENGQKFH